MDIQEAWRLKYRITLETPRLLLRPLIAEDVDWLAALFVDPEVNRFLWDDTTEPEQARKNAEAVIRFDLIRPQFGHWAIEDKVTGMVHGWTELSKLSPGWGESDEIALSYVLRRLSWGHGIATEAAGRLLQHAFENLGLEKVMAVITAGNTGSRRVLEKLGMGFAGSLESVSGRNLEYFEIEAPIGPELDDDFEA